MARLTLARKITAITLTRGVSDSWFNPVCFGTESLFCTLCPLGEPEIAIGHEPRIEPWLPRN